VQRRLFALRMKFKYIPFILVLTLAPVKIFLLLQKGNLFDSLSWTVFSAVWMWIEWSFWKDKDMPSYAGSFRYADGKNQIARTFFVVIMIVCYLIGVIGY
jgi:hypothetical protein